MQRRMFCLALTAGVALAAGSWAQEKGQGGKPAWTDPATAPIDFKLQGEYTGKAGGKRLGAQVIALGNGTFQVAFLPGGLPGEGWDATTRVRVNGKLDGEKAVFPESGASAKEGAYSAVADGSRLKGQTDTGAKFSLKKVMRKSKTLGAKPPKGALVLFNGTSTDAWVNGRISPQGWLMAGTQTKQGFGSCQLHIEFQYPFMPESRGQGRANSGVFMDGRYEVQVLDSFGLNGENNECGSVYSIRRPDVNMALPPLSWQTYDIDYTAPEFDAAGKKTKNARITVRHNGVVVHNDFEIPRNTAGGAEGPTRGPIQAMNHGDPLFFRNVWVVEKK